MTGKQQNDKKEIQWNLKKAGGWLKYAELTETCEDMLKATENEDKNIEEVVEQFEKDHTKIKFQSFGKAKLRKRMGDKEMDNLIIQKGKCDDVKEQENIERNIAEKIMAIKSKKLEDEIEELTNTKSRTTGVFKLLRKVNGPKKATSEALSLIHI